MRELRNPYGRPAQPLLWTVTILVSLVAIVAMLGALLSGGTADPITRAALVVAAASLVVATLLPLVQMLRDGHRRMSDDRVCNAIVVIGADHREVDVRADHGVVALRVGGVVSNPIEAHPLSQSTDPTDDA